MIGRMGDQQSPLRMTGHGRNVVKEIVGMRQNDRANPALPIVISSVIDPYRTERRVERSFTRASKQPDASVGITYKASEIIIGIGGSGFRLLARAARRNFRFRTIHRQISRATAPAGAGQRGCE